LDFILGNSLLGNISIFCLSKLLQRLMEIWQRRLRRKMRKECSCYCKRSEM
jgi:hypothetical protein